MRDVSHLLCKQNIGLGCFYLAKEILHTSPDFDSNDMVEALNLFNKGAKFGNAEASYACWKLSKRIQSKLEFSDDTFTESLPRSNELEPVCHEYMIRENHAVGVIEWSNTELNKHWISSGKKEGFVLFY